MAGHACGVPVGRLAAACRGLEGVVHFQSERAGGIEREATVDGGWRGLGVAVWWESWPVDAGSAGGWGEAKVSPGLAHPRTCEGVTNGET